MTAPNLDAVHEMGRAARRRGDPLMANLDRALRTILDAIQPGPAAGKVIDGILRAWRSGWKAEDAAKGRSVPVPTVSSFEDDAEYGAGWNEPPVNLSRTV
jgi:hypothetical protein